MQENSYGMRKHVAQWLKYVFGVRSQSTTLNPGQPTYGLYLFCFSSFSSFRVVLVWSCKGQFSPFSLNFLVLFGFVSKYYHMKERKDQVNGFKSPDLYLNVQGTQTERIKVVLNVRVLQGRMVTTGQGKHPRLYQCPKCLENRRMKTTRLKLERNYGDWSLRQRGRRTGRIVELGKRKSNICVLFYLLSV